MAVDQTGDDRPAPERPKRQWRTARGEAFLPREEWRRGRQGKKTSRPLRMPIELSCSSAVFGQTCPIETAVGEPADRSKGIRQWRHGAVIGWKRPAPRSSTPIPQTPGLIARFDAPAGLASSYFSPRCRYAARQAFDRIAASSQHARQSSRRTFSRFPVRR